MEQTILFGNGINMVDNAHFQWSEMLRRISDGHYYSQEGVPNTIQYESILQSVHCNTSAHCKFPSNFYDTEDGLKGRLKKELEELSRCIVSNSLYHSLFSIPAEFYLTTNYDGFYESVIREMGYKSDGKEHNSEVAYNMRRRKDWENQEEKRNITIWTPHGTCEKESSMMLGLDQYVGSIARLNSYFNSGSVFGSCNGDLRDYQRKMHNMRKRNSNCTYPYICHRVENYRLQWNLRFWVDTFFLTDVHIIGFGFSFDEIDLWWVLIRRKRLIELEKLSVKNRIMFYGYAPSVIRSMLEDNGVDVSCCITEKPKDWKAMYEDNISRINDYIMEQK